MSDNHDDKIKLEFIGSDITLIVGWLWTFDWLIMNDTILKKVYRIDIKFKTTMNYSLITKSKICVDM